MKVTIKNFYNTVHRLSKTYYIWGWVFFVISFFSLLNAQETITQEVEFLRIQSGSLQTAVYSLEHPESFVRIKLVGLIHVGDAKYYKIITKLMNDMDYVFYEGIRMDQTAFSLSHFISQTNIPIPSKKGIQNIVNFQSEFAKYFNLVEQGDYLKPKPNWINADVNFFDFVEILKNLNINLEQLSRTLTLESKVSLEQDISPEDVIQIDDTRSVAIMKYKRRMAKYLVRSARELCYDENMKLPREAIIIQRNKVALEYMDEKLRSNLPLEIGILYGAAHLPNFLEVLQEKYKFQIQSIIWLDAWRLENN